MPFITNALGRAAIVLTAIDPRRMRIKQQIEAKLVESECEYLWGLSGVSSFWGVRYESFAIS